MDRFRRWKRVEKIQFRLSIGLLALSLLVLWRCAGWETMTPIQKARMVGDYYGSFLSACEVAVPTVTAVVGPEKAWMVTSSLALAKLSLVGYQKAVEKFALIQSPDMEKQLEAKQQTLAEATTVFNRIVGQTKDPS